MNTLSEIVESTSHLQVQPNCKVLFDEIEVISDNNEPETPPDNVDICEDHNVNAKCIVDTKKEKVVFTTRAHLHQVQVTACWGEIK